MEQPVNRVLAEPACNRQQQGAALLLTLTILLILTILGVSSVQTTSLQEKMARNSRDMNSAFQAAAAAILEVEAQLERMTSLADFPPPGAAVACASGRCRSTDGVARWTQGSGYLDWHDPSTYSTTNLTTEMSTEQAAKYLIEYVAGPQVSPETSAGDGAAESPAHSHIFRITARATGSTSTAVAMIQTTYGKDLTADAGDQTGETQPINTALSNSSGRLSWRLLDSTSDQ